MTKRPDAKCPPRHLWSRVEYCVKAVARQTSDYRREIWLQDSHRAIDEWLDACEAFVSEWEKAA